VKIVSIPLSHEGKKVMFSRLNEIFMVLSCPEEVLDEIKSISQEILDLTWPLDERSILDLEVNRLPEHTELLLNFQFSRKKKAELKSYLRQKRLAENGLNAAIDEAIIIGEKPRYQVIFKWRLSNEFPEETITLMQQHLYTGLGLSKADIRKLSELDLTDILEKIREQQEILHKQKQQIQQALDKIERDLEAAKEAQMNLLPKGLFGVEEIEFSSRFIPSQYVSGDIYNIFRLDENHLGAYHIDISGHGVPAALFSVSLSQMLNTNISSRNLLKIPASEPPYYKINSPDAVFSMLDEDNSFRQYDIFFTMVYMVINLKKRTINFSRAGHNPPVIIRKNGVVEIPMEGSVPIGWSIPRHDVVCELNLDPGDRIYLFSDGITEAFNNEEEQFSQERMVSILQSNLSKSVEEGLDILLKELKEFTGTDRFEDDLSIIGLSWKN